ncbi:tetratricopeptide repeat protein [Candidatus Frankia alpina]|uniref:tetratricopeptide repeat protein n=1 Tax=Candidatus Frankia alpina TaxID=2699483 RepID=UPI0013D25978|nr:tetratricopeptide repeat protein [Candidatus Frankia alpina]
MGDAGAMGDAGVRNEVSGRTGGHLVQARDIGEVHLHGAIPLGVGPAVMVVPGQLPAVREVFVDRAAERAAFHDIVGRIGDVPSPRVVPLSGLRGVGKSAGAARWAHEIRDRFDGGQLYLDLGRQRGRGAVAASEVLERFIEALGGDPHDPPGPPRRADEGGPDASTGSGQDAREAARLRRLQAAFLHRTAGRRLLILLDGVATASQVTAVLPASAESVVVVTSHLRLEGLLGDGAELIGEMVGADRAYREPDAVAEVVRLCGGLPIALRAVCGQLRGQPRQRIATVAERLRDERRRLDRFSRNGDRVVEAAFEIGYLDLPEQAQVLYRVLGVHPGLEFDVAVPAAALRQPAAEVAETLDLLVLANLVDVEEADGRHRLHELVRVHALRRAELDDPAEVRDRLLHRMIEVYLRRAVLADRAVLGPRLRLADEIWARQAAEFPPFGSPAEALRWFETERLNLLGCVRAAARRGWDTMVWVLCEALWAFYYNRKHYADWRETHELAVEAAHRLGHRAAEARMRSQLGRVLVELGLYDAAHAEFDAALTLARAAADRRLAASVVEFAGRSRFEQGEYPAAIAAFEQSRAVNVEIGNPRGAALQTHHLGRALSRSGRRDEAVDVLADAAAGFVAVGDERNRARVLISLGETYRDLGRYQQAERVLTEASSIMRRRDIPFQVALALELLADVARRAGDDARWRAHLEAAFVIFAEVASPRAESGVAAAAP